MRYVILSAAKDLRVPSEMRYVILSAAKDLPSEKQRDDTLWRLVRFKKPTRVKPPSPPSTPFPQFRRGEGG